MAKKTQNIDSDGTNGTISDKKRFLEIFEKKDAHISKACKASNVGRQTYYNWLKDEEFKKAGDDVKEGLKDDTEDYLLKACKDGNVAAIIFRCKTVCKDRGYDEKHQIELTKPFDRIELEGI